MVFVPAIMFTSFLLGANVPPLFDAPFLPMPINLALVGAVAFASGYVLMEPVAGGLATPIILAFAFIGTALVNTYGVKANTVAIVVHVVSWLVQFAGHGIWEKKAPALLVRDPARVVCGEMCRCGCMGRRGRKKEREGRRKGGLNRAEVEERERES